MIDFRPDLNPYNKFNVLSPFKFHVREAFPYLETDFDALTEYQLLSLVVKYLNQIIANMNIAEENIGIEEENIQALYNAYSSLQDYVNNYFDNLDVQDEINNKLNDMAEDGTLQELIATYLQTKAIWCFDTIADMKASTNLVNGSFAKTLGYYEKNDRGSGFYKIRNKLITDTIDNGFIHEISSNLVAELIIENDVLNLKQLGAQNNSNINTILTNALASGVSTINIGNDSYTLSSSIECALNNSVKILGSAKIDYIGNSHLAVLININTTNDLYIDRIEFDCENKVNNAIYIHNNVNSNAIIDVDCIVKNCYCGNVLLGVGAIGVRCTGSYDVFRFGGEIYNITMDYSQYSAGSYTCRGVTAGITSDLARWIKKCIIKSSAIVDNVNFTHMTVESASDQDGIAFLNRKYVDNDIIDTIFIMEKGAKISNCGSRFIKTQCKTSFVNGDFVINNFMTSPIDCQEGNCYCRDINITNNHTEHRLNGIFNVGSFSEDVTRKPKACYFENINLDGDGYTRCLVETQPRGNGTPLNKVPDIYINNVKIDSNCLFVGYIRTHQDINVSINNCFVDGEHFGLIACLSGASQSPNFNLQLNANTYIGGSRALVVNRISGGSVVVAQQRTTNNINYLATDTEYLQLTEHFGQPVPGHVRVMFSPTYQ